MTKQQRLQQFFTELYAAAPAATVEAAYNLVCNTLNTVEDRLSGVPYNPASWKDDGRLYPPQADRCVEYPERPTLVRCRSRNHYLWIDVNGAILISNTEDPLQAFFSKPGANGRTITIGGISSWMLD